jgi:hypothetical protein
MEEHSDGDLDNLVAHGQTAGASLHNGSEPVTSETRLVPRNVEPDWSVAGSDDGAAVQAGAAGNIETGLSATSPQELSQKVRLLARREEGGERLVVPFGVTVITSDPGRHGPTLR